MTSKTLSKLRPCIITVLFLAVVFAGIGIGRAATNLIPPEAKPQVATMTCAIPAEASQHLPIHGGTTTPPRNSRHR